MIRTSVLLLLLFHGLAHAQGNVAGSTGGFTPRFDTTRAADVYAAAIRFMLPRTLEPVSVPELMAWGLNGVGAIDPRLRADFRQGVLRLQLIGANRNEQLLVSHPIPSGADPLAWAGAVAALQAIAFDASTALQAAGSGGIIRGFFDELFNHLDPYSRYTPPQEAEEDRTRRAGQAGLGITLTRRGGQIVVQGAASDGPAAAEGVLVGDIILSVDGQTTRGKDVATVLRWLQGPEDTGIVLSWRGRDGKTRNADIARALIPPETVHAERRGALLVLRITDFNNATGQRVANEIEVGVHGENPAMGIVLDLRGNRGGVLRQAQFVADTLLGPGVLATTQGRDPDANRILRSTSGTLAEFVPVIVTVDGRTASAAEVLAAALADRGRAVVVGSTTLGKGLVQTIAPMPDGGELRITWSRIIAPRGWPIQTLGVMPQICTSLGDDALDKQMAELTLGRAPLAMVLARHHSARSPLIPQQALNLRAPCPAAEGTENDLRIARTLVDNPAIYAAALLPPMIDTPAEQAAPRKP